MLYLASHLKTYPPFILSYVFLHTDEQHEEIAIMDGDSKK
jgi:hypothetical protein